MRHINHLVGIPFEQCDCWRLIKKYYVDVLGIELPDVGITCKEPDKINQEVESQKIRESWIKLDKVQDHCIVTMNTYPNTEAINHLGVYVGKNGLLHVRINERSYIAKFNDPIIQSQVRGFYKWRT